ncbi:MAG: YicC family protein [Crocinitomicaceae bacterium]|nr:YicC family protein [Crocinitomicaceae bacterium]
MIKSMTGYGKASGAYKDKKITVEIKSLNSKNLDLFVRSQSVYKEKEIDARKLVSNKVERGKVELNIQVEKVGGNLKNEINQDLAKAYFEEIKSLNESTIGQKDVDYVGMIMRMPDVFVSSADDLEDEEWTSIMNLIEQAVDNLDQFRIDEGKSLEDDLKLRIRNIRDLLGQVDPHENARIEGIREKMRKALQENFSGEADENRFEQELIYYIEKLDVSEEKVRLANHLDYFDENLTVNISNGKKLGFISQEIGREINTLGSKSYNSELQKIVVQMKDELEKIKEQVLNIL